MAKEKRLDMKEELYMNILEYSRQNSIDGRSMGERVLKGIEHMYSQINDLKQSSLIQLGEEERKLISSFQNFRILDDSTLTNAVNEAIMIYVSEHKKELQEKISKL